MHALGSLAAWPTKVCKERRADEPTRPGDSSKYSGKTGPFLALWILFFLFLRNISKRRSVHGMSDTLHSAVPPPSARHSSGFHGHRRRRRAAAGAGTRSGPGLPARVAPRVRPPRDDAAPGVRAGRGPLQSSASTSSPSSSSCRAAAASVR